MSIVAGASCDKCGRTILFEHTGKTHITRYLRAHGWSVSKKKHCAEVVHCPNCRKTKGKKNEEE